MKTLLAATIVLRGATLVDGTGAPPQANVLLVIRDGRILSVSSATPAALAALPPGSEVVDAGGRWIVPGLIDAHVHRESDADLQAMLRWGVTSVRLMAEDVSSAEALARASRDRSDIPDVLPAAPIFTAPGGWWAQGESPDSHLDRYPSEPAGARESVRRAKGLGSTEIKLMLDDMDWCRAPQKPYAQMSRQVANTLIVEARRS